MNRHRMLRAVILSGGLDSTVALAEARSGTVELPTDVIALTFDYGQRHAKEVEHAKQIAHHYGVPQIVFNLNGVLGGGALLDHDADVPEGHYEAAMMAQTVVPGRNLLFIAAAAAHVGAQVQKGAYSSGELFLGVHAGDHAVYLDCTHEFVGAVGKAVYKQSGRAVTVEAPFMEMRKSDIVARGRQLDAPLDLTWSCYKGGEKHCGKCGTCVERREAFRIAEVEDRVAYEPWSVTS